MAIGASTVWRVRVGGDDANGAGFDSTISGAGTDYSQQDSPQLSVTDIACSNTTTVTSATGGFTSAMIGNAIRITGGGATSGYYFITARTDTNTITVDRTPGTVTNGTGKVGGAAATLKRPLDSANATGDKVVAGNTIYVRGSGSDNPTSDDYTTTGYFTPVSGNGTSGRVRVIGENGRPRLKSNGLYLYSPTFSEYRNLYFTTSGNSILVSGIICLGGASHVDNVIFNTAGFDSSCGLYLLGAGISVLNCEVFNATTMPTLGTGAGIYVTSGYGTVIQGCRVHHNRNSGILITGGYNAPIIDCLIYGNAGSGVSLGDFGAMPSTVYGNTINDNGSHGIELTNLTSASVAGMDIRRNLITNHNGTGKYGIHLNVNSAAVNDKLVRSVGHNWLYNNSGHYLNLSQPATDSVGTDPQYTDAANGDFTLGTNAKGFIEDTWCGSSVPVGYREPGAVQRQEVAASGGGGSQRVIGG